MPRKPYPSETAERFIVRLPDGMRDRIAAEAKRNGRSMNSEIVARLAASLDGQSTAAEENIGNMLADVITRATKTPQFASAIMELRQQALKVAPELAEVEFEGGKPIRKRRRKADTK